MRLLGCSKEGRQVIFSLSCFLARGSKKSLQEIWKWSHKCIIAVGEHFFCPLAGLPKAKMGQAAAPRAAVILSNDQPSEKLWSISTSLLPLAFLSFSQLHVTFSSPPPWTLAIRPVPCQFCAWNAIPRVCVFGEGGHPGEGIHIAWRKGD